MLVADVTDQFTDVSSLDVMIARVIGVVIALVITGLLILLWNMWKRIKSMDSTLGTPKPSDDNATADKPRTLTGMTAMSVAQGDQILEAVKWVSTLAEQRFAGIDAHLGVLDSVTEAHARDLADTKTAAKDQGQRLGDLETRLVVVETRLDTCPATATPSTGG